MHLCICTYGVRPPDHHLKEVKFFSDNILYVVIAILVGIVIYMYQDDPSDEVDPKVLKYEIEIERMKREVEKEQKKTDSLTTLRDSTLAKLANKEKEDKEVIHEKFEKKRTDILVLSDDESVQLLTKNLKGI